MHRCVLAPGWGCIIHRSRGSERNDVREIKGETNEMFENISQSRRENWLHPTVAVRHSDSYFDSVMSG